MNQHLSGAERRSDSTGETQAPELDAMTWGAEQALKAMARLAGTGFQLARSDFAPLQGLMYRRARGGKGQ